MLDATVTVDKPIAGKQHVKIVWHVRHGDGSEIGTVAQENDVPEGLLDGPWGDVAFTIAVAAQDGIMQLVARGAPQSGGNSELLLPDTALASGRKVATATDNC